MLIIPCAEAHTQPVDEHISVVIPFPGFNLGIEGKVFRRRTALIVGNRDRPRRPRTLRLISAHVKILSPVHRFIQAVAHDVPVVDFVDDVQQLRGAGMGAVAARTPRL